MATIRRRAWRTASGEARESWQVDFVDQQGRRRHKQFSRKKDADGFLVTARSQVQDGTFTPESTSSTIGEAIGLWLARAEAEGLEYGTVIQYRQHREHILKLIDGNLKLAKLSTARVEQLRDDLLRTHSREMARKILVSFKSVIRDARRRGLIASNPAADTTIDRAKRHRRKLKVGVDLPTVDEFRELLEEAADDPKARAMISLAGLAGLRASELRGLAWSDVNLGSKPSVTVTQRADAWGMVGSPKSESAHRTIELGEVTCRALKEWKVKQPTGRKLVFGTSSDRPDMLGNLTERTLRPLTMYGWHALRHFAITSWIVSGRYDLKTVQHLAGHSTLTLTLDRYGHFVPHKDAHARASEHEAALLG